MKKFTPSQVVNFLVQSAMIALVVMVVVFKARHIPVDPDVVALAGTCATILAGGCRSYLDKFAGFVPPEDKAVVQQALPVAAEYLSGAPASVAGPLHLDARALVAAIRDLLPATPPAATPQDDVDKTRAPWIMEQPTAPPPAIPTPPPIPQDQAAAAQRIAYPTGRVPGAPLPPGTYLTAADLPRSILPVGTTEPDRSTDVAS